MNRQTLSRAALMAARSTEWLVLVVLLAVSVPPILLRHESLTIISRLNLLDDSWLLDTSYKAAGSIWFGRDVAFTFGPLYQWLSSAPSRWLGISTSAIYATWYTLPLFVISLSTFLTVRLLLPEAARWRRALLVVLAVVFWSAPDVRVSLALLAFAIFVRLTDAAAAPDSSVLPRAIAVAAICIAAFLVSADSGLDSTAALLLCVAASAIVQGRNWQLAKFLIIAAIGFAVLVLLTNAIMSSPLNLKFWRSGLAIAGGYRWFEPTPMIKQNKRLLLESLAMGVVVFGVAWLWRKAAGPWTRRPAFLMSGFALAFLMMQTGLVRSDPGHVIIGIYPMVFLCGAIAIDKVDSERLVRIALPLTVVIATLALAHPFPLFSARNVLAQWRQIAHPILSCPEGFDEFDRACFTTKDAELLKRVSTYVRANTAPGKPIAIFPYETAFGLTSRRQVAGGVLQSYLVNGAYLSDLELTGLRQAKPPFALYFLDGVISIPLDGVPNFTRSPDVWFYFLRHYRAEGSPASGVLGLVRDDRRDARLTVADERIADAMQPVRITKRSTSLDLGAIHWPSAGGDFIKLRLRVEYPPWWRLRKPSALSLQMSFADGSEKTIQFVVEPNHANDVWVYPWDDSEMGRYFSAEESDWPHDSHAKLTALKLLITPFDWISVVPTNVSVESIEAVRVSLR